MPVISSISKTSNIFFLVFLRNLIPGNAFHLLETTFDALENGWNNDDDG